MIDLILPRSKGSDETRKHFIVAKVQACGLTPVWPVEANLVFVALPRMLDVQLRAAGAQYYARPSGASYPELGNAAKCDVAFWHFASLRGDARSWSLSERSGREPVSTAGNIGRE